MGDEVINVEQQDGLEARRRVSGVPSIAFSHSSGHSSKSFDSENELPEQGSGSGQRAVRSTLLSKLVGQLKRGEITKTELFKELQQLQGSSDRGDQGGAVNLSPTDTFTARDGSTSVLPRPVEGLAPEILTASKAAGQPLLTTQDRKVRATMSRETTKPLRSSRTSRQLCCTCPGYDCDLPRSSTCSPGIR